MNILTDPLKLKTSGCADVNASKCAEGDGEGDGGREQPGPDPVHGRVSRSNGGPAS